MFVLLAVDGRAILASRSLARMNPLAASCLRWRFSLLCRGISNGFLVMRGA